MNVINIKNPLPQNPLAMLNHNRQGFSLIELLVSIALLAILGGIGVSIFAVINTSYNQSQALSKMQTQGSQVLEVMERSIRGASSVEVVGSSADGCERTSCLKIGVPTSSLEYQINGGCSQTVYAWYVQDEDASRNGSVVRYYLDENDNLCSGSVPIELFDTDKRNGVSVEQNGTEPVFDVVSGANGIDSVKVSFNLSTGVDITTDHANVPLRTTVGLRDY